MENSEDGNKSSLSGQARVSYLGQSTRSPITPLLGQLLKRIVAQSLREEVRQPPAPPGRQGAASSPRSPSLSPSWATIARLLRVSEAEMAKAKRSRNGLEGLPKVYLEERLLRLREEED
ncbi:hypothetical protein CR513_57701, partial [Mucuna pruriens]